MDLAIDPLIAQRKKQDDMQALLSRGALLAFGQSTAPLKIVIFSDFQCPYCRRLFGFFRELTNEERSQLQITYRLLPLSINSWAHDAAAITEGVALQNRAAFSKLQEFFFSEQEYLSKSTVLSRTPDFLSQEDAPDINAIRSCLSANAYQDFLERDERLATDLGITGTPTVFLDGKRISVRSADDLRTAMKAALGSPRSVKLAPLGYKLRVVRLRQNPRLALRW